MSQTRPASPVAGFLSIATTNVLLAFLTFATTMLCARFLGPTGRGALASIQMWAFLLATLAMVGLPDALVYFCATDPTTAGRVLASAVSLALLLSACAVAAGYVLLGFVLHTDSPAVITAARIYLLVIPLVALQGLCYHPLRALRKFVIWNCLRILPAAGLLVAIGIACFIGRREPSFISSLQLMFLAALSVPILAIARREIQGPYTPSVKMWPRLLAFGAPSLFSSVSQVLNLRMDQMVMAALLPSHDLGLYVAAVGWSNAVIPIVSALASVIFPKVASLESHDLKTRALCMGTRAAATLATLISGTLFMVTPWLFPLLFGPAYHAGTPVALVLSLAGGVSAFNLVLEDGLRGLGMPRIPLRGEVTGLIVTCVMLYLTIPRFGIMGAAVTSLAAYLITGITLVTLTARTIDVSPRAIWLPTVNESTDYVSRLRVYAAAPVQQVQQLSLSRNTHNAG